MKHTRLISIFTGVFFTLILTFLYTQRSYLQFSHTKPAFAANNIAVAGGYATFSGTLRGTQFIDNDNSSYFIDPNATGTSLITAGSATISGTFTVGNGTTNTIESPYGPFNLAYKSGLNTWTTGLTLQDTTGNVGIGTTSPSEKLEVAGRIKDVTGYVAPVGSIIMYGAATAPTGWLLCDGSAVSRTTYADLFTAISTTYGTGNGSTTFNVPDMRGIFPRGAGTSAKLTNANGTAFAGTLGTYQNDKMQGHRHAPLASWFAGGDYNYTSGSSTWWGFTTRSLTTGDPVNDGTNGTPRTGTETNPANLGLTFIIKY